MHTYDAIIVYMQVGQLEARFSAMKADDTKQKQVQTRKSKVICSVLHEILV